MVWHKLNNINDPWKCCQSQINLAKHVNLNIIAYTRYILGLLLIINIWEKEKNKLSKLSHDIRLDDPYASNSATCKTREGHIETNYK